MAFIHGMGGSGEQYTETSLWTNQSPSSAFSGQDVSLSESIDNFKYIAVRYKSTTTSSAEGSQAARVIYLVEDVKKATSPSAALEPVSAFGNLNSNNSNYFYRYIVYKGSTTLFLSNSYSINASGNNTSLAIPLEILGLNELDTGKRFDETTLWTNNAPTTAFAAGNVTLSNDIDNYDYIKVTFRNSTSNVTEGEFLDTPANIKKTLQSLGANRVEISMTIAGDYTRRLVYVDDTTFNFSTAYKLGASGTSTSYAIPLSVVGCKFA